MKMEQRAAMADIRELRQGRVSVNDIKWDLIKIIEPYDGILATNKGSEEIIRNLFEKYLSDLKYCGLINEFYVNASIRQSAITYDVSVKLSEDRSMKKLKIHVGVYQAKAA